jgi:hypothetical protein
MKRQRDEDSTKSVITEQMIRETTCVVEGALRRVQPYWHNFTMNVKLRMMGKGLVQAMQDEFASHPAEMFQVGAAACASSRWV